MEIIVRKVNDDDDNMLFGVEVTEESGSTKHKVTVRKPSYKHVVGEDVAPETLVEKSFEFLLEREPKESILSSFDLNVISKYFPEYETEIRKYV